jgi:hypothetical protein
MGEISHILSPLVPSENTNVWGLHTKVWAKDTYTSFLSLAWWYKYGQNEDYNFQDCWLDILDGIKSSYSIMSRFVYKQRDVIMVKPCGSFQVIFIDFLHVDDILVGLEGPNAYG